MMKQHPTPRRLPRAFLFYCALCIVHCAFLTAPAFAQNTLTLRPAARVDQGNPITLADIADIAGPDANTLGAIIVHPASDENHEKTGATARGTPRSRADAHETSTLPAPPAWIELDLAAIRDALTAAEIPQGRIALNGASCAVRFIKPIADLPETRPSASAPAGGGPTIRDAVTAQLARFYNVPLSDLRLTFRAPSRAESSDLLDRPLPGAGADVGRIDIQPGAADSSSRIPVHIFVFEGDRLTVNETILVDAVIRRPVLIARRDIDRRETIAADDFLTAEQWVPAGDRPPATAEAAAGAQASNRIQAGDIITTAHVEPPIVVNRGDIVTVHCLAGAFTIQLRARALEKGRDGDVIPFRAEGADRNATPFTARMSGRGTAVMLTGAGATTTTNTSRD